MDQQVASGKSLLCKGSFYYWNSICGWNQRGGMPRQMPLTVLDGFNNFGSADMGGRREQVCRKKH